MKKKKGMRIAAFVLAAILILTVLWFSNGLIGNPLSKLLAKKSAEKYIKENFGDGVFRIESVGYDFKMTGYFVRVVCDSSRDSHFEIRTDMLGRIGGDSYENVTNGWNTAMRIDGEYRKLTQTMLDSLPYTQDFAYGMIEYRSGDIIADMASDDTPPYALDTRTLVLDKEYDASDVGRQAGRLYVYLWDDAPSAEKAAEMLLAIRKAADDRDIGFKGIYFSLSRPKTENFYDENPLTIREFSYDDIIEENLTERVQQAIEETTAYYAAQDAMKQ